MKKDHQHHAAFVLDPLKEEFKVIEHSRNDVKPKGIPVLDPNPEPEAKLNSKPQQTDQEELPLGLLNAWENCYMYSFFSFLIL